MNNKAREVNNQTTKCVYLIIMKLQDIVDQIYKLKNLKLKKFHKKTK